MHWAGGPQRWSSDHSATGKANWSQAFLCPAGRTLLGKALFATFTKPPPPWCFPHKHTLGVRGTLETSLTYQTKNLARKKAEEAPPLALHLRPCSLSRVLFSYLQPHLSFLRSFQNLHLISAANLS